MPPATSSRAGARRAIAPPILFGSHIDSVPSGGNFDGDLGSLAAIEVIQACQAAGITTRHPLEMVVWAHEEGMAFGRGTAGSRVVAGELKRATSTRCGTACAARTPSGRLAAIPSGSRTPSARRVRCTAISNCTSSRAARSTAAGVPIGVVEGIVAIDRYDVTIGGFANHAGTTPMAERQDALLAASQLVLAVRRDRDGASRAGRSARSAAST